MTFLNGQMAHMPNIPHEFLKALSFENVSNYTHADAKWLFSGQLHKLYTVYLTKKIFLLFCLFNLYCNKTVKYAVKLNCIERYFQYTAKWVAKLRTP